jgi:hypothetical protein
MGGNGSALALNTVEAYDPASNTWSSVAPMLTARGLFGAGDANGLVYAMGGYDSAVPYTNAMEQYSPPVPVFYTFVKFGN